MLFNEPKLLKSIFDRDAHSFALSFSALQRAEIAEICLKREPHCYAATVSVLFNEPKLLKSAEIAARLRDEVGFSALQRAEIAEIGDFDALINARNDGFSALQRAEIAEMRGRVLTAVHQRAFQCSSTSRNC